MGRRWHHGLVNNTTIQASEDHKFFGQPRVLSNLFGVEMWERFSFYGMQGILAIYLYWSTTDGGLGVDKSTALSIVGAYGGAVYLSTILFAWIADRIAGAERTLFWTACLVMAGHVVLAVVPGLLGVGIGLVMIALGSGGVKATATSLVGSLYAEGDQRRDAGFSIFYMGINIGALVGPLLTGLLQKEWGFHFGFGLAALGMALGLIQYSMGRKRLPASTHEIVNPLPANERGRYVVVAVVAVLAVVGLVLAGVITASNLSDVVVLVSVVAAIACFTVMLRSSRVTAVERRRVLAMIPMFVASAVFWSLYQQQFTVLAVYSDERLDRNLFGWEMPVSWVNSINPVFIIVLAGVFAALWTKWGDRQPSSPVKFGIGTLAMGVAFWLFLAMPGGSNSAPLIGLAGILLVFTIAELMLSPVGLSLATKLAPAQFRTQMVGLFFISSALGTAMAGSLAGYYDPNDETPFFAFVGLGGVVVGLVMLALAKPIRALMSGVR